MAFESTENNFKIFLQFGKLPNSHRMVFSSYFSWTGKCFHNLGSSGNYQNFSRKCGRYSHRFHTGMLRTRSGPLTLFTYSKRLGKPGPFHILFPKNVLPPHTFPWKGTPFAYLRSIPVWSIIGSAPSQVGDPMVYPRMEGLGVGQPMGICLQKAKEAILRLRLRD